MSYSPYQAPTIFVDPEGLNNLLSQITPDTRAVLIGYNEMSKHLINLAQPNIVAVYDPEPWKIGIRFRGVPVIPMDQKVEGANLILACGYAYLYEAMATIIALYDRQVRWYWPPGIEYKVTSELKPFDQEDIYRRLFAQSDQAPPSMMAPEKLKFLLEVLRTGLRRSNGAIVEMGSWQGGSAWYMAKLLSLAGAQRDLYLVDIFETHMMDPTATMCNDEIERRLAFYPGVRMLVGLIDDPAILAQLHGKRLCFAHYDLGPNEAALQHLWEHLDSGCPLLLDNYGHVAAEPWWFDAFFAQRGAHVLRLPWSEQGVVFK
jgi:predicted O-methyltransferase YrrM